MGAKKCVETHIRFDNKNNKGNLMAFSEEQVLRMTVPLFLRFLEYSKEEATTDVDLHFLTEKLIELNQEYRNLAMKHYPEVMEELHGKV